MRERGREEERVYEKVAERGGGAKRERDREIDR